MFSVYIERFFDAFQFSVLDFVLFLFACLKTKTKNKISLRVLHPPIAALASIQQKRSITL